LRTFTKKRINIKKSQWEEDGIGATNMKIKLSKSQWEGIGKKAGWVKESQSLIGTPSAPITTPISDNERFKSDVEEILSKMASFSHNLNNEQKGIKTVIELWEYDKDIDYSLKSLDLTRELIKREGKEILEMINDLFAKKPQARRKK
jgi:hypothetical protein